ncbi:MAG: TolC family protein [Arcobacteraceae bacterium]|nr:TolC family protein [Arcobacteraceae bacterium]
MKNFNFLIIGSLVFTLGLNADDVILQGQEEAVLSQTKKDILNYSYKKSIEDSNKLEKDWINPITYKYIYNNGETYTTQKSFISISQPVFKSGGIYSAIKYANSMQKYSKTNIDGQKKELIKQTIDLLFQIKNIDININKQKLLIKNSLLDIERKQEQVLGGTLDTSFLDNAILDSNTKQNALIDLEYQKQSLINNLAIISDKRYDELNLPILQLVDEDSFLKQNIYIKKAKEDIDSSYWMKKMVTSNYLPTVNFTADYTKYHDRGGNIALSDAGVRNVGFNITIPLDVKYSNQIQSSKLEYLQKKSTLEDKQKEELSIFKNSLAKIKSLDAKIKIAQKNVELYDSLLTQIIEQHEVGIKTESDVQTMVNSKQIRTLDIKSLNIEKQIQLLEIYSRVENG